MFPEFGSHMLAMQNQGTPHSMTYLLESADQKVFEPMPDSDQKVDAGVEEAAKQQQIRGPGLKTWIMPV